MTCEKQQQAEHSFKQGHYEEALEQFRALSSQEEKNSLWHYRVALCLQQLNDYPGASRAVIKAQQHDKKNPLYHCYQGALFNHQGLHKKAIPCFKNGFEQIEL